MSYFLLFFKISRMDTAHWMQLLFYLMAPAHSGLHATDCRFVCCRNAKRWWWWWWCSSHCRLSPGKPMRMQPVPLCLLNVLRPSASSTAVDVWIAISNWLVHHQVCCCLVTTVVAAASVQRHTQKNRSPTTFIIAIIEQVHTSTQ